MMNAVPILATAGDQAFLSGMLRMLIMLTIALSISIWVSHHFEE